MERPDCDHEILWFATDKKRNCKRRLFAQTGNKFFMRHSATAEKRFQMLQKNGVTPFALELLKSICAIQQLEAFALGGGTSLALRMGHRISIDLDFFTNTHSIQIQYFKSLQKSFHP